MELTQKKLLELCNEYLKKVEADYECTEIHKTRYRGHEYEAGAAHFNIKLQPIGEPQHYCWVHIFYPLSYLQEEINNGNKIVFKERHKDSFMDGEFDLTR